MREKMKKADETPQASGGMAEDIKKNFGIDISDLTQGIAKDYLKETVLGRRTTPVSRSKFSKALDAIASFSKSMWWIPAAAYLAIGVAIILVKLMAKFAGV
jgi:hypothetical protein